MTKHKIYAEPYKITSRREGDIEKVWAKVHPGARPFFVRLPSRGGIAFF